MHRSRDSLGVEAPCFKSSEISSEILDDSKSDEPSYRPGKAPAQIIRVVTAWPDRATALLAKLGIEALGHNENGVLFRLKEKSSSVQISWLRLGVSVCHSGVIGTR